MIDFADDQQCENWLLRDGFTLDVKVSYNTWWILNQVSGSSILVFRSLWVRFAYSVWNKLMSWKQVPYVISSMTLLIITATPGIVTTRIGSKSDVSAGCPWGWVDWILARQQGTPCCLRKRYHSRSSLILLGMWFCAIISHSSRVFPHIIDSSNIIITFSESNLHIIAAATEVKVLPRPISSATSAPGISESQSHLLTMNHMAHTQSPETSFWAGLELHSCGLEHGHRLNGESDGHSAAWPSHPDTHVQFCCWLCWEQC